jgi:hypothetical protein
MAITVCRGVSGLFALTGHNFRARAWSANLNQELNDSTGFAQAPWREQVGGLKSMDGVASGYLVFDASTTTPGFTAISATGATGTLTANVNGGTNLCKYEGTFTVSTISPGIAVDGNGTVAVAFRSSGAVVETWDES